MTYDVDLLRDELLAPAGPLARLEVVDEVASTNSALADELRADPLSWPAPGLLVAERQTAGRGRAGRTWVTPPGTSVTTTFVVRPALPADAAGWLPLLAGLGAVRALRATAGVPVGLKWPNDLVVDLPDEGDVPGWGTWRKVGGILTEVVPGAGPAVLVGLGINVTQARDELPVPSATSLALAGAQYAEREQVLVATVLALADVAARFAAAGGDAVASGLADEVAGACVTLGRDVAVDLPGGARLEGRAQRLDRSGALVVRGAEGERPVLAGDVLVRAR